MQTFLTKVVDLRYTWTSCEDLVSPVLISELWCITLSRLKFDGYSLRVEKIGAFEDDTEGSFSNLLADSIVNADDVGAGAVVVVGRAHDVFVEGDGFAMKS